MKDLTTIILAAGQGTRMKSSCAKVLHLVAGKPLLHYPLSAARAIGSQKIVVVVGYQEDDVKSAFPDQDLIFATQTEQLGTGHAVMCAREALTGFTGDILLLCGDVPLIEAETLEHLIAVHREQNNAITLLSTAMEDPTGYGRIVRNDEGAVQGIIEEKDASPEEKEIVEINSGVYCFDAQFLLTALDSLSQNNAQNEYYLTDTVAIGVERQQPVEAVLVEDESEIMGVNNRIELAMASAEKRRDILGKLMLEGVTVIDPWATYIDAGVSIGRDTVIYPNTFITGDTRIGERCVIQAGCQIVDSTLGDGVNVKWASVIEESSIKDSASIGPFAHLRPGADIGEEAKVGNFVEVKKSSIGKGSKASHLTYLGDTTLGDGVNVGAGTITCNYDGYSKYRTVIEDDVFIGSNTSLVAPVEVGKGAIIGAGSTITKKVPANSLAVERSKQVNHNNMAAMLRKRKGKK